MTVKDFISFALRVTGRRLQDDGWQLRFDDATLVPSLAKILPLPLLCGRSVARDQAATDKIDDRR